MFAVVFLLRRLLSLSVGKIQPATLRKSWKVLLLLFSFSFFSSTPRSYWLAGWLAGRLEVTASTNAARNQSPSFSREGGKQEVREASQRHGGRHHFRFSRNLLSRRRGTLTAFILKSWTSCRVAVPPRRAWSCCQRRRPVEVLLSTVCLWVTADENEMIQ